MELTQILLAVLILFVAALIQQNVLRRNQHDEKVLQYLQSYNNHENNGLSPNSYIAYGESPPLFYTERKRVEEVDTAKLIFDNGLIFMSQVSLLIPIFGLYFSWLFLRENFSINMILSLIIILSGLWVLQLGYKKTNF